MPIAEATIPMASASPVTDERICRRDAPIARSSADSRVRWATRIENVLWMLNVATMRAMPANASRMIWKKPRKSLSMSACCSAVSSVLRQRLDPRRHQLRDLVAQGLGADAVLGGDEHGGDAVGPVGQQVASRVEREGRVGRRAEAVDVAERGDADDRDLDRVGREDGGAVADGEVAVLGRAAVDDDLVRRGRGAALGEAVRVEVGIVDPVGGGGGRAVAADAVAVGVEDRADALDRGHGGADAVDGGDLVDDRRRR